jgi:superfamily II DNA or RNA helicase
VAASTRNILYPCGNDRTAILDFPQGFFNLCYIMSFTLYPDQLQFTTDINHSLAKYQHIIACAATGFGKSKVAITICWAALAKGRTVLVMTEADKIYTQLDAEIPNTVNINATARIDYLHTGRLYLAMVQTLARRPNLIAQFAAMGKGLLIICDEAHIGTATKLLLQLRDAYVIGLTATPTKKWSKHLPILYSGIVVGSQPEWLVANNRLTPYQHAQKVADNLKSLKVGSMGDYTEDSQERIFDTVNAHDLLLADLTERDALYHKAMIFCASIKSAESLARFLTEQRYTVSVQHSRYDIRSESEQSYSLGKFHDVNQLRGKAGVNICISIASMNKGYDFPPVDWIILWRATTSLPLYLQMCGRGSRLSPSTGKSEWLCTDWGGNGKRLGRWDHNHDWAKLWNTVPKKRDGVAPVKDCPVCHYLVATIVMVCPNCGHEYAANSKQPENVEAVRTVMLEKQNAQIVAMSGRRLSELTPIELAQWATIKGKKNHAIRVAKAMEQDESGYLEQFGKAMGYKKGWVDFHIPAPNDPKIDFYDAVVK